MQPIATKIAEKDATEQCAILSTEIETLEAEMLEMLQHIKASTGPELEQQRRILSDMAAAYDIALADANMIINDSMLDCDLPTARNVVYPLKRKQKNVRIMRQTAIETQLRIF